MAGTSYFADQHDLEGYTGLFTDNAVVHVRGKILDGIESISNFFRSRNKERITCHLMSPPQIKITGEDTAEGISYYQIIEATADEADTYPYPLRQPTAIGEYNQKYRCVEGEWRIEELVIKPLFKQLNG